MTKPRFVKRHKFAHEILGLTGISALAALMLFLLLVNIATTVAEVYCFEQDIPMTEFDWMEVDRWIFGVGAALSVSVFCVLFLALLGERLRYIRKLSAGIDAMRLGKTDHTVPLEGSNELTELADAINYMSDAQQQIRQKEQTLAMEKEQLIRTLSHDIRTPLTSILAYSEYLAEEPALPAGQQKAHLQLIRKKAEQIRELTDILLDGSRRQPEHFENAKLLMEQLAEEFSADLEERFSVRADLSGCGKFSGAFDVQELRRIFDNLGSNVRKYADPAHPVRLAILLDGSTLVIRQTNAVRAQPAQDDSYKLGIHSIRRIAQHYGGSVSVRQDDPFEIVIFLSDY